MNLDVSIFLNHKKLQSKDKANPFLVNLNSHVNKLQNLIEQEEIFIKKHRNTVC